MQRLRVGVTGLAFVIVLLAVVFAVVRAFSATRLARRRLTVENAWATRPIRWHNWVSPPMARECQHQEVGS